jgi:hypothetical protein
VIFSPTLALAVLVHPFAVFVTVTVYVPGTVTVGFCCVELNPPGPLQLNAFPVVVPAVSWTEGA